MTSGKNDSNPSYLFDQAWEAERMRLRGLEAYYDSVSIRWLERTGVGPGWSCLEVGGGAGSIARWLASKIGPMGHLVVTDLDVRFLDELRSDRVEVRRHDITSDDLEPGAFDLAWFTPERACGAAQPGRGRLPARHPPCPAGPSSPGGARSPRSVGAVGSC